MSDADVEKTVVWAISVSTIFWSAFLLTYQLVKWVK